MSRAVLPGMIRRRRGHILNVSSLAGTNALPGVTPDSSSKAGLSHFTAGLRAELKGTAVTTTLAEIGPVEGEMMDSLRSYEPTRRALHRLKVLQLEVDLEPRVVVLALTDAIERERRHVRLPKRDVLFPMMVETPRRLTELLLTGVR
jgi:short-subunit dehydrogenase